jgi:hypothetical protein
MSRHLYARGARRLNNRFALLVLMAMLPGMVVYGWRAMLVLLGVLLVAGMTRRVMHQRSLPEPRVWPLTLPAETLLLVCLLPAELAGGWGNAGKALWPVMVCAGVLLVLLQRLRSAAPWPAFDPVVATIIVLHLTLGSAMYPNASLQRHRVMIGDVLAAKQEASLVLPWHQRPLVAEVPALHTPYAAAKIDDYLAGRLDADLASSNLDSLIRDALPPLEDLALAGHPMPIGQASGMALVGIILWAAFRRTIDWRVPVISLTVCYFMLLVIPTPASILPDARNWRFFPSLQEDIGVETGLTFVHYLLFASNALFTLGLLATRADSKPLHGRAIVLWSLTLGILTAVGIMYVSITLGPLLALLMGPWFARILDRWLKPKPMTL